MFLLYFQTIVTLADTKMKRISAPAALATTVPSSSRTFRQPISNLQADPVIESAFLRPSPYLTYRPGLVRALQA
jgi:hypothetical protein